MKTVLLNQMKLGVLAFAGVAAVAGMTGCGGGSQTRTADQWQQEVGKEIDGKTADLRACYRQSGNPHQVATTALTVTGMPSDDATSTLSVSRASVDPGSAALDDCVTKALAGLPLPAGDSNIGDGTWKVTFDPAQLDPTAPVPPAAPAAAAPPAMGAMPKS
ncbi:MAG: hypothetical protein ABI183_06290 [Polyangiaceae bacterium]